MICYCPSFHQNTLYNYHDHIFCSSLKEPTLIKTAYFLKFYHIQNFISTFNDTNYSTTAEVHLKAMFILTAT